MRMFKVNMKNYFMLENNVVWLKIINNHDSKNNFSENVVIE